MASENNITTAIEWHHRRWSTLDFLEVGMKMSAAFSVKISPALGVLLARQEWVFLFCIVTGTLLAAFIMAYTKLAVLRKQVPLGFGLSVEHVLVDTSVVKPNTDILRIDKSLVRRLRINVKPSKQYTNVNAKKSFLYKFAKWLVSSGFAPGTEYVKYINLDYHDKKAKVMYRGIGIDETVQGYYKLVLELAEIPNIVFRVSNKDISKAEFLEIVEQLFMHEETSHENILQKTEVLHSIEY